MVNRGRQTPVCVTKDGCATTITARYGNMDYTNLIGTQHYPMTAVLVEYDL